MDYYILLLNEYFLFTFYYIKLIKLYSFIFIGVFSTAHVMPINGRYYCLNKCGRHYKNKRDMGYHFRHECGMPSQYQCNYCQMKYINKSKLKQHTFRKHNAIYKD